jgi:hypothetical protein
MRFEVVMAVNMSMVVFWVVMPYGVVGGYQHNILPASSALKMEALFSFETLVPTYESAWYHHAEDH